MRKDNPLSQILNHAEATLKKNKTEQKFHIQKYKESWNGSALARQKSGQRVRDPIARHSLA